VAAEFGPAVVGANGALDRAALARIVFADPERLGRLNAITHPRVAARRQELVDALPPDSVVVDDIPLLAESTAARASDWDLILVVDAPDDVRLQRLVARGLSEEDARQRMSRQASRSDRLALADVVIDNSGEIDDLRAQVHEVWRTRLSDGARRDL